ncbi:MAG: hypothetical protein V3S31_05685 [Dehalococcoidia bacterium]
MSEVQIVAKALNDLADEWHWVVMHDAEQVEAEVYIASLVDTICGILISGTPQRVRLYDMGAPDEPTCQSCLDSGLPPGLRAEIEQAIEAAESAPVEVG